MKKHIKEKERSELIETLNNAREKEMDCKALTALVRRRKDQRLTAKETRIM